MKKLLPFLAFFLLPGVCPAMSGPEYQALRQNSPEFRAADDGLAEVWRRVYGRAGEDERRSMLLGQRRWLREGREGTARALMAAGMAEGAAYAEASRRRMAELSSGGAPGENQAAAVENGRNDAPRQPGDQGAQDGARGENFSAGSGVAGNGAPENEAAGNANSGAEKAAHGEKPADDGAEAGGKEISQKDAPPAKNAHREKTTPAKGRHGQPGARDGRATLAELMDVAEHAAARHERPAGLPYPMLDASPQDLDRLDRETGWLLRRELRGKKDDAQTLCEALAKAWEMCGYDLDATFLAVFDGMTPERMARVREDRLDAFFPARTLLDRPDTLREALRSGLVSRASSLAWLRALDTEERAGNAQ